MLYFQLQLSLFLFFCVLLFVFLFLCFMWHNGSFACIWITFVAVIFIVPTRVKVVYNIRHTYVCMLCCCCCCTAAVQVSMRMTTSRYICAGLFSHFSTRSLLFFMFSLLLFFVVACCHFSRSLKLCFHLCNMCEQSNKMNACHIDSDIHSYKWIFIKIHVHCIQGDCKDRWDSQIHKSVYIWI